MFSSPVWEEEGSNRITELPAEKPSSWKVTPPVPRVKRKNASPKRKKDGIGEDGASPKLSRVAFLPAISIHISRLDKAGLCAPYRGTAPQRSGAAGFGNRGNSEK